MRYPAGHKEQTRAKILRAAAKVFRREGYHAASVDKVMEEAGLTAGGFYAHFGSKEALLAETLAPAAAEAGVPLDKDLEGVEGPRGYRLSWNVTWARRIFTGPRTDARSRPWCPRSRGRADRSRQASRRSSATWQPGSRAMRPRASRRIAPWQSSPSASALSGLRDRSRTSLSASASSRHAATWPRRA